MPSGVNDSSGAVVVPVGGGFVSPLPVGGGVVGTLLVVVPLVVVPLVGTGVTPGDDCNPGGNTPDCSIYFSWPAVPGINPVSVPKGFFFSSLVSRRGVLPVFLLICAKMRWPSRLLGP